MILQTRKNFIELLKEHNCKIGIELGISSGKFSKFLVDNYCFKEYYCVDSWNSRSHLVEQYMAAYKRLKRSEITDWQNINIYRATFEEVLPLFPDNYFDFIYIDGYAHTGQEGGKTIEDWYCKLKPEGVYAGHDYDKKYILTKKNVDKFCSLNNLNLNVTVKDKFNSWWVIK